MRGPRRVGEIVKRNLLVMVLMGVGASGQTSLAPVAGYPPTTPVTVAPVQPSTTPPAAANAGSQQRVLTSDGHSGASASTGHAEQRSNKDEPQTLHLIVGRSLVIDTPERLRRVYVANPAVLDSLTSSPHQIVLTAKLAGTSSVVLWSESGRSQNYTVLADLDVAGLEDSLAEALPGDHVDVKASQGRVYLSGVVGSDAAVDGLSAWRPRIPRRWSTRWWSIRATSRR
jgi:Flp pilus assembly secretin CpaC